MVRPLGKGAVRRVGNGTIGSLAAAGGVSIPTFRSIKMGGVRPGKGFNGFIGAKGAGKAPQVTMSRVVRIPRVPGAPGPGVGRPGVGRDLLVRGGLGLITGPGSRPMRPMGPSTTGHTSGRSHPAGSAAAPPATDFREIGQAFLNRQGQAQVSNPGPIAGFGAPERVRKPLENPRSMLETVPDLAVGLNQGTRSAMKLSKMVSSVSGAARKSERFGHPSSETRTPEVSSICTVSVRSVRQTNATSRRFEGSDVARKRKRSVPKRDVINDEEPLAKSKRPSRQRDEPGWPDSPSRDYGTWQSPVRRVNASEPLEERGSNRLARSPSPQDERNNRRASSGLLAPRARSLSAGLDRPQNSYSRQVLPDNNGNSLNEESRSEKLPPRYGDSPPALPRDARRRRPSNGDRPSPVVISPDPPKSRRSVRADFPEGEPAVRECREQPVLKTIPRDRARRSTSPSLQQKRGTRPGRNDPKTRGLTVSPVMEQPARRSVLLSRRSRSSPRGRRGDDRRHESRSANQRGRGSGSPLGRSLSRPDSGKRNRRGLR